MEFSNLVIKLQSDAIWWTYVITFQHQKGWPPFSLVSLRIRVHRKMVCFFLCCFSCKLHMPEPKMSSVNMMSLVVTRKFLWYLFSKSLINFLVVGCPMILFIWYAKFSCQCSWVLFCLLSYNRYECKLVIFIVWCCYNIACLLVYVSFPWCLSYDLIFFVWFDSCVGQ